LLAALQTRDQGTARHQQAVPLRIALPAT
jgi:hypothetical protein